MFRKIEISIRTVLFAAILVAATWLVFQIKDILFLVFIAFLLMTAIYPLVTGLERLRIPRTISILIVYVLGFGFLGIGIASAIPALVVQFTRFIVTLPDLVVKVLPYWGIDIKTIAQQVAPLSENVLQLTIGIFSNLLTTFTVLVFTFYFLLERRYALSTLTSLFGETFGRRITDVLRLVERRLGAWVRGELLLMTFIGVFTYV